MLGALLEKMMTDGIHMFDDTEKISVIAEIKAKAGHWNARSFLYQLGTIKVVLRGVFDGTRQEAYGRANCEPAAAG
jgi:hypothetical protein